MKTSESHRIDRSSVSILQLGYARAEITPPVGIYHRMWGAARHDRASGIHRPLNADVLVLEPTDGTERVVRVQLDLVLLGNDQTRPLTESIVAAADVNADQVLVTHSHSHSAGLFLPDRIPLPGGELIESYLEYLRTTVEALTHTALRNLQPVTMTYAHGRCNMAANRDYRDPEREIYVTGYNPSVAADDTLVVARVEDALGSPVLTVIHYACHPTTLAWDNSLLSPDYVGAMREVVEREIDAPCVFFQGACGDLGPKDGFTGDTEVADRNGRQLGYAALSALESLGPARTDFNYLGSVESGATIGTWGWQPFDAERLNQVRRWAGGSFIAYLPYGSVPDRQQLQTDLARFSDEQKRADAEGDVSAARDAGALAERCRRWLNRLEDLPKGDSFPYRYSVFQFGDALWITCSAEPYNALTRELRRRFPDLVLLLSPIAGDAQLAYLLPMDRYGQGLYQEEPSCLDSGCLELLTEAITQTIEEVTGHSPAPNL